LNAKVERVEARMAIKLDASRKGKQRAKASKRHKMGEGR